MLWADGIFALSTCKLSISQKLKMIPAISTLSAPHLLLPVLPTDGLRIVRRNYLMQTALEVAWKNSD